MEWLYTGDQRVENSRLPGHEQNAGITGGAQVGIDTGVQSVEAFSRRIDQLRFHGSVVPGFLISGVPEEPGMISWF